MAKTVNAYIADAPSVEITIDSTNVTDHALFTQTFTGEFNIVTKSAQPQVAARPAVETFVAGADAPILSRSTKTGGKYTIELDVIDDYFLGNTGEIEIATGPSVYATVHQILDAFFQSGKPMGGFSYRPAGNVVGRIETNLTNAFVEHVGQPQADANSGDHASFPVTISAEDFVYAAIT